MQFHASRHIAAPPAAVWATLLDVGAWPSWDSGVTKVEGEARDGGKVTVHSEVSPGRAFPVRVALDGDRRVMTWTGGMPFGLFPGVRTFAVTPDGEGCELDVREQFTGPLVGPMAKRMPDLQPSFDDGSPTGSRPGASGAERWRDGDGPVRGARRPDRRRILELLGREPQSVAVLADQLPISRPAVSRHLRLLKEAGFVEEEPRGHAAGLPRARRRAGGDPGLPRAGLGGGRRAVAAGRGEHLASTGPSGPRRDRPAACVELELRCSAAHAFATWTERFGLWWPPGHTTSGDPDAVVPRAAASAAGSSSARATAARSTGARSPAGTRRAGSATCWHIRRTGPRDRRGVHFEDAADGASRIRIEHTGWERLGDEGAVVARRQPRRLGGLLPHFRQPPSRKENAMADGQEPPRTRGC